MNTKHENEINQLKLNNSFILKNSQEYINSIPLNVTKYTNLYNKINKVKSNYSNIIEKEYETILSDIELQHNNELSHLKLQYESYFKDKNVNYSELLKKFNNYKIKKTKQLDLCETEIVDLIKHIEKLESILDSIEIGKYPLKSMQGIHNNQSTTGKLAMTGLQNTFNNNSNNTFEQTQQTQQTMTQTLQELNYGAIILPKGLRPKNPMKTFNDSNNNETNKNQTLLLAKKIYAKYKLQIEKLNNIKEETFQKTLIKASKLKHFSALNNISDDPILQLQLGDFLNPKSYASIKNNNSFDNTMNSNNNESNNNSNENEMIRMKSNSILPRPKSGHMRMSLVQRQSVLRPSTATLINLKSPNRDSKFWKGRHTHHIRVIDCSYNSIYFHLIECFYLI